MNRQYLMKSKEYKLNLVANDDATRLKIYCEIFKARNLTIRTYTEQCNKNLKH